MTERDLTGTVLEDRNGQVWVVFRHHLEADEVRMVKLSRTRTTTTDDLSRNYTEMDPDKI